MQSGGINIRIVVMNNVLPRSMRMHFTYDLKGSTYKRRASRKEREKSNPTFKDLDFLQDMHEGLYFDTETYNALMKTLQRDCRVRTCRCCDCLRTGVCGLVTLVMNVRSGHVESCRLQSQCPSMLPWYWGNWWMIRELSGVSMDFTKKSLSLLSLIKWNKDFFFSFHPPLEGKEIRCNAPISQKSHIQTLTEVRFHPGREF